MVWAECRSRIGAPPRHSAVHTGAFLRCSIRVGVRLSLLSLLGTRPRGSE